MPINQALPLAAESGDDRTMWLISKITRAWQAVKRHRGVSTLFAVMAVVAAYDTFSGQVEQLTGVELPSLHNLVGRSVTAGAHLLPPSSWAIILLATLNIGLLWHGRPNAAPTAVTQPVSPASGDAAIGTKAALIDALRVLIFSRFALVMDRYLSIVFTMLQSCKNKDIARVCEDLLDQGIRDRFYKLQLEAKRTDVDPETLGLGLDALLRMYGEARFYIHRFQRICEIEPARDQIQLWLDADRDCLIALRDLRARGLSQAVEKIDDGVMASTRSSDWLN